MLKKVALVFFISGSDMTEQEVWQRLRLLESFDNVQNWFKSIHNRELNSRRTNEIICAAKQAREYLKNAKQSDYSVRSLLAFYGIACLSRSVTLLLKENGGEETLTKGHGLEVHDWSATLSGEISQAIAKIANLQVVTCSGLFNDFIESTENIHCLHLYRSGVDWVISYGATKLGMKISFMELLSRIPDFENEIKMISSGNYAAINDISYQKDSEFKIGRIYEPHSSLVDYYGRKGYSITPLGKSNYTLTCPSEFFLKNKPLFLHNYTDKNFGSIPQLFLVKPLECGVNYSEMGFCYLVSYFMGMLSRYYPTHWLSLINGGKGDLMWPVINRAQNYVEKVFPELLLEFIQEILKKEK